MKWTPEKPFAPGYYWTINTLAIVPEPCIVLLLSAEQATLQGEPSVLFFGAKAGQDRPISLFDGWHWIGPISAPEP